MFIEAKQLKKLTILTISACTLALAGCGGGDEEGDSSSAADNNIYLAANNEMEPNNDLMNANIPQYANRPDPGDQT